MPIPNSLPRETLMLLISSYSNYILEALEEGRMAQGWQPVCIDEFYENEFQFVLKRKKIKPDGGIFAEIRWSEEDLNYALIKRGVKPTARNREIFIDSRSPGTLIDRSVEDGWDTMDSLILDLISEGFLKRNRKAAGA